VAYRVSRESAIGIAVTLEAVVAMAFEHVFDGDPAVPAFLFSAGLSAALAAVLFGLLIPRTKRDSDVMGRAAIRGMACSVLAVPAFLFVWLGLPFPLAGGGVALGLVGRNGDRRRLATGAVALGAVVLALGAVYLADVVWHAQL